MEINDFSKFKLPLTEENRKELNGLIQSSKIKWKDLPPELKLELNRSGDPEAVQRMLDERNKPNSEYGKFD